MKRSKSKSKTTDANATKAKAGTKVKAKAKAKPRTASPAAVRKTKRGAGAGAGTEAMAPASLSFPVMLPISAPTADGMPLPEGRPEMDDNVLGRLTWNEALKSYHGKAEYCGAPVDLSIVVGDREELLDDMIGRARQVVSRLDSYAQRAAMIAADKTDQKSQDCGCTSGGCSEETGEYESPAVMTTQFSHTIRLKSVEFHAGGGVTFLHDDGNSFWGQLIEVSMSPNDEFTVTRRAA